MTTEFTVRFSDDFTDHVREVAEEAVRDMDLTDLINDAIGEADLTDAVSDTLRDLDLTDYMDLTDYAERSDVEALTEQVDAMRLAMVALVTALAKAGIVAEVTHKEEGN